MEPVVHKRHRVKIKKDLSGLNPKLRQSLLEFNEIEDMAKIYSTIKRKLGIADRRIDPSHQPVKDQQPKKVMEISIEQRLQLIKKKRNEEKLDKKMRKFINVKEKPTVHIERTPMRRLIRQLQDTRRGDISSAYLDELRQSEDQLIYVKNNSRRHRSYSSQIPDRFSRSRVISLQTGMPLQIDFGFHTLDQLIQQSRPKETPKSVITTEGLVERMEEIFPTEPKLKEKSMPQDARHYVHAETEQAKDRRLLKRARRNLTRSFKYSKDMTATFAEYESAKGDTRQKYKDLVETWKVDRPFTSQIRNKNYQIENRQNLKKIDVYRKTAELERQTIFQQNRSFYLDLVNLVVKEARYRSDIPLTKHLCEGVRRNLELFNKFQEQDLQFILQQAQELQIPADSLSRQVLDKINNFLYEK